MSQLQTVYDLAMLQVCICTHNPRNDIFEKVLRAIKAQTSGAGAFELMIVDNASDPPLNEARCRTVLGPEIAFRMTREPRLGNAYARATAASATSRPWVLFVDDDNELEPGYIKHGLDIIEQYPDFGCFGGRLILPDYLKPADWLHPLLGYLAIKDGGEHAITRKVEEWGVWYPPTAGAFVRRPLLDRYLQVMAANQFANQLGRKGRKTLNSGEDSLMMLAAYALGYSASYQPGLILRHHLAPERFRFGYLVRLMYGYGRSRVLLARAIGKNLTRSNALIWHQLIPEIIGDFKNHNKISLRYAICMLSFRFGYLAEALRLPV